MCFSVLQLAQGRCDTTLLGGTKCSVSYVYDIEAQELLKVPHQRQHQTPLLTQIQQSQNLRSCLFLPHPTPDMPGDIIQRTQSLRMQRRGQTSSIGRIPYPGRASQQCLDLLDNWALDPDLVVRKILIYAGCPDFPDQWLNIVKGYGVDLAKVLGAYYSSDVEARQSQDLGELLQLSIWVPKHSKAITNNRDWVMAFGNTIQAIYFTLPGRNSEYVAYQAYMSELFASITPHSTLESLTLISPSHSKQPIKSTFTSLSLACSTISEPFTRCLLIWCGSECQRWRPSQLKVWFQQSKRLWHDQPISKSSTSPIVHVLQSYPFWRQRALPQLESRHLSLPSIWMPILTCLQSQWVWRSSQMTRPSEVKACIRSSVGVRNLGGILCGIQLQLLGVELCTGLSLLSRCLHPLHQNVTMLRPERPFITILICSLSLLLFMSTTSSSFSPVIPISPLSSLCVGVCTRAFSHSLGTIPNTLQRLQMRQPSCRSRLTRRSSLVTTQGLLAQICCQECTVCPFMQCPSPAARSFILWLITVLVSLLSTIWFHTRPTGTCQCIHPLWQIKQVVSFYSKHYVDQCNVFGNRTSQHICHAFILLVTWITVIKVSLSSVSCISMSTTLFHPKEGREALLQVPPEGAPLEPHLTSPAMGMHWPAAWGVQTDLWWCPSHHWL